MLVAPGPLSAVDPTPAPADGPEMFRLPDDPGTPPRAPAEVAAVGPAGFHESVVFSGLISPTAMAFAADGRVFVAEKRGTIKFFDSLSDPSPTTYADLQTEVHDYWDRGLLGLALDPNFTTNGRLYVLYTYNHILGDPAPAPKWVNAAGQDICPNPPGSTTDGCVASARLQRLETNGSGTWDGQEHVLVEGWCQVHPSHSIGTVAFGPDGALYAGAGESASFVNTDYGQDFGPTNDTTPDNPCGDPPSPVGTALSPPSAEGGALRSQDMRTTADPAGLSGTIIRVNPSTGAAMAGNWFESSPDLNMRRVVAYGLRNPFRFTFRPGTNELWIGDVGALSWEEFNRVLSPTAEPRNFGWPCYEGPNKNFQFDSLDLTLCENLYADGSARGPYYTYPRGGRVVPGDPCPDGPIPGAVISGAAFYPTTGGPFPAAYRRALFFSDYGRKCIWAMRAGADGLPDATQIETFASGLSGPVDLKIGPDGGLYYVGFDDGKIHRITIGPRAVATAEPTSGPAPLDVEFDGSASTDPKGGSLAYAWDLDGDGQFDDSTAVAPTKTYTEDGVVLARLRVTDALGAFDIASVSIGVGNTPPVASIGAPSSSLRWSVGDPITFSGSATDAQDGTVPGSRLAWSVIINHCPDACHPHTLQTSTGASGSFPAPDHGYPSSLRIRLVATDSHGTPSAPVSVTLQPKTVDLSIRSDPPGVQLTAGEKTAVAPFTATVINKSVVGVSAPATATIGDRPYGFAGWSDGLAASHSLTARSTTPTLIATYAPGTTYVPMVPVRLVDTRTSQAGPLTSGVARTFAVAGAAGIPANAVAITGNLTAVAPTAAGWISLSTSPSVAATTSALNFPAGDTRANGVTMLLGDDGRLSAVFKGGSGTTHLILDVTGYFLATNAGATFTPIGPSRVLDSRTGQGGFSTPFVSGTPRRIQLSGVAGIPVDAVAVTGNLTVTDQTAGGYVSMTTSSKATPAVSTINLPRGDTRANGLTIKLSVAGRAYLVYVGGATGVATADLIFDVTGYYRAGTGGLRFYPLDPRRIFDSRFGNPPSLRAGLPRAIGVVAAGTIPSDVDGVASNVTVAGQTQGGYLSITTAATTAPKTSTINFPLGDVRANNTVNALDGAGRLWAIFKAPSGARTHLIVDLAGYFR
jgi:glucose/arabinose dehydrogenase